MSTSTPAVSLSSLTITELHNAAKVVCETIAILEVEGANGEDSYKMWVGELHLLITERSSRHGAEFF